MPPSDDDIKELWSSVDGVRTDMTAVKATLSRIETLLSERCTSRGDIQQKQEARLTDVEKKMWWFSGAAAVAGYAISWVAKMMGGNHG